jgi:hypothetical protein
MGRVTVNVDVEVWLDDIETEDLAEELSSRGDIAIAKSAGIAAVPPLSGDQPHPLHEIYYALKFGLDERALQLTRAYLADELGVVL